MHAHLHTVCGVDVYRGRSTCTCGIPVSGPAATRRGAGRNHSQCGFHVEETSDYGLTMATSPASVTQPHTHTDTDAHTHTHTTHAHAHAHTHTHTPQGYPGTHQWDR